MLHLNSNIPLNIYYTPKSSEMLRFTRTTSDSSTYTRLSNKLFKKMLKQGKYSNIVKSNSKYRSIISLFNKIFDTYFKVFKVFTDTGDKFIKKSPGFFLLEALKYCSLNEKFNS